jgi:hypothetical protein
MIKEAAMKKYLTIGLLTLFCVAMLTPQAWAGAKQRHRWKGVAIGVGAAILGHALIHGPSPHYRDYRPHRGGGTVIIREGRDRCDYPERRYRRHRHSRPARGWDSQRIWISPVYEKVWNPGHYDVNQRWVPGRWIKVVKEPGHWAEKRRW